MRHFLRLSYDGSAFHGWQRQPGDVSVQQMLEEALSLLLRQDVEIVGAGRTDTGVHAKEMFAHFDGEISGDKERFLRSLNRVIGHEIAVHEIIPVTDDAHARFDALARTYKYFLSSGKNPFMRGRYWECPYVLDTDVMNEAADFLKSVDDFTSFAKLHTDVKTNICKVTEAKWAGFDSPFLNDSSDIVFTITADRFLRNMVRAIIGTLVDVGRGKISLGRFKEIVACKDRCAAGSSAPAHGLFLWHVEYPENIFIN